MRNELFKFIQQKKFPCVMAKSLIKHGLVRVHEVDEISPGTVASIHREMCSFVDEYRRDPERLSSFVVVFSKTLQSFSEFEDTFWFILKNIHHEDKLLYPHDPRVHADVKNPKFSFSVKSEAFFILALHPQSPRWSRRFKYPAIIFNPHAQFEHLRNKGLFTKIRNVIRGRDKLLQGSINPMLNDFGEKSEVFQYMGKSYKEHEPVPLNI